MIFTIATKNFRIPKVWQKELERYIEKMLRLVPEIEPSLILADLVIQRHEMRDLYQGSITLRLPIKNLHVSFEGYNADECLNDAFERLYQEIRKYRGTHFINDSEYPRKESIRKSPEIFFYITDIEDFKNSNKF